MPSLRAVLVRQWPRPGALLVCLLLPFALTGCELLAEGRSSLAFAWSPGRARVTHATRLEHRGDLGCTLTVVGTIHSAHLDTPAYSLWDLGTALARVRPDLVALELTPDAARDAAWGMGPIEMAYVATTARASGLPVRGVDWFQAAGTGWWATHWRSDGEREDSISARVERVVCVKGAAMDTAGRRAMLFIGYEHVRPVAARLQRDGWEPVGAGERWRDSLFTPVRGHPRNRGVYPAGLLAAIQQRIVRDSLQLALDSLHTLGAWAAVVRDNLAVRRRLAADIVAADTRSPSTRSIDGAPVDGRAP